MIITLLTDFGIADGYVAEMKGVLLSRAPQATLVDVSHQVPVGDIRAGQYVLSRTWHQFPRGTVHLAVVDPGVGTERRALVAESAGHRFLAPDNGLLSFLPADARFFALPIPSQAAPTFHGRDLFAPAAAALSLGEPVESLGTAVTDSVRAPLPIPRGEGGTIIREVIYIDHFGILTCAITRSANPAFGANFGNWTSSRITLRSRSASVRQREQSARCMARAAGRRPCAQSSISSVVRCMEMSVIGCPTARFRPWFQSRRSSR